MRVYPAGYSRHSALIEQLMQDPKVLLIDIRYSPNSKMPAWTSSALKAKYGKRYRIAGAYLGNTNYTGGPMTLANPARGIAGLVQYLKEGHDLILLCGCAEYEQCHRHLVVEMLCQTLPSVEIVQPEQVHYPGRIKCISMRQPYATWMANPGSFINAQLTPKQIENRDWNTSYRGRILIHASRTFDHDAIPFWSSKCPELGEAVSLNASDYPLGCIVGEAELVKVIVASDSDARDPWFCGPYGFLLAYAHPIDPIPCRGALKLFDAPESVLAPEVAESGRIVERQIEDIKEKPRYEH